MQLLRHVLLPQVMLGQVFRVAAQHDVRTTSGHVGGDGHGPQLTGLGHDLGLLLMVLGVQHRVGHVFPLQHPGNQFAFLNGNGTHQHRLPLGVALLDLTDNGPELARLVFVHHIGVVHPNHRACWWGFPPRPACKSAENSSSSVRAVPVMPESLSYRRKKFWKVMVARVLDSLATVTPSLASMA